MPRVHLEMSFKFPPTACKGVDPKTFVKGLANDFERFIHLCWVDTEADLHSAAFWDDSGLIVWKDGELSEEEMLAAFNKYRDRETQDKGRRVGTSQENEGEG